MAGTSSNNTVEFGRVVYIEPNNNINGTGRGTNFTFEPEDYSILVDLQVDVVDRFAFNNGNGKEQIQFTLEWDAKGNKTSLFKGTNGLLTTKAMDTSFLDIKDNLNQEAIGINSIDIRYNSWNYPEITINFSDIRGASLMATSDYLHEPINEGIEKAKYADNFANTFFSTFFRFPYPRYTLIVKGFYGRPVSYSLCVNDFKTTFDSSTGNFNVTVSFIGYMYGLLTDIPMRLLFAAPYSEYVGAEYWKQQRDNGIFVYQDSGGIPMVTFLFFNELLKNLEHNLEKITEAMQTTQDNKKLEERKKNFDEIQAAYTSFKNELSATTDTDHDCYEFKVPNEELTNGEENEGREYLIIMSAATPTDDIYNNQIGEEGGLKLALFQKIKEFNASLGEDDVANNIGKIADIRGLSQTTAEGTFNGVLIYKDGNVLVPDSDTSLFTNVVKSDYEKVKDSLEKTGKERSKNRTMAVCILRVDEFKKSLNTQLAAIDLKIKENNKKIKEEQEETFSKLLGFKVSLKNVIDMALAHLDTFMECMYRCMEQIKEKKRLFSDAGLDTRDSDVEANVDTEHTKSPLYLPPFFAFRTFDQEKEEYTDAWIGDDPRFSDRQTFLEIQLIDGLLDGILNGVSAVTAEAAAYLENKSIEEFGRVLWNEGETPTFINDVGNPYQDVNPDIEEVIAMFAFRCMLAGIYSVDYPDMGSRFNNGTNSKKKNYFIQFGKNDAKNFITTDAFKTFRKNFVNSTRKDNSTLGNIGENDFLDYITGGTNNKIVQDKKSHLYFAGVKSPLFSKAKNKFFNRDDYVISYGDAEKNKIFVPLNYTSPRDATNIVKDALNAGDSPTVPVRNCFGYSRNVALPYADVIGDDSYLVENRPTIEEKYSDIAKDGEGFANIGWFFKDADIWKDYFSGTRWPSNKNECGNEKLWFPSVALRSDLIDKDSGFDTSSEGNLYEGNEASGGKALYAAPPILDTPRVKYFFTWRKNFKKSKMADDNYIAGTVIPEIIGENKEEATVYGLACADATLFESRLYLTQEGEENLYAKAFLFLHSLPTSEYGVFGQAVSTIIKRTYTPAVTDIPLATALFIGALYYRDKKGSQGSSESDPGEEGYKDELINYSGFYKEAKTRQIITYNGKKEVRIPLYPINPNKDSDKNFEYQTLITKKVEIELDKLEIMTGDKSSVKDLNKILDGKDKDFGYEPLFYGFWDVEDEVKEKFIGLFENWVKSDFRLIDDELSLKLENGVQLGLEGVQEYRDIVYFHKIFNANGDIEQDNVKKYTGKIFSLNGCKNYNDFISKNFHSDLWKYRSKLGISMDGGSLLTIFRTNTEPLSKINKILTSGCTVKVMFPRVLMTRVMFGGDDKEQMEINRVRIDKETLESGWNAFKETLLSEASDENKEEEEEKLEPSNTPPASVASEVKLSLYETLKNIHDKWLVATSPKKYKFKPTGDITETGHHPISENFYYINSFYEDVGNEIILNIEELPKQLEKVIHSVNDACSLYSFMYDVSAQARTQLLALPVFNDMTNPEYVRNMFTPIPYDDINFSEVLTETQYVFLYPEEASKHLDLTNTSRYEEERYKYKDDSFILVEEGGNPADDGKAPKTFYEKKENKNVPVIGVTFAKQNQSFFKTINVSMDNPKTTEVAINNTFLIAEKYNKGNTQITALGQDLFPIYSNYSYECTVEMMGCACIMPLMYFQLNNIPMFKGTYIIYNVNHRITPGNMTTSFTGQRLSRYRKKRNEKSIAATPNDEGLQSTSRTNSSAYGGNFEGCYTPDGHKLEHDSEYSEMSKISGVERDALRAVEYAEVRYNTGFFADNKLRIYYDPWQAHEAGVSGGQLTVNDQFESNWVIKNTYKENINLISQAAKEIEDDKASACTISGAFGIPSVAYKECGASSVGDLLKNSSNGFRSQGVYFATLLKNKTELKNALQNKDWAGFAKIYKGAGGVTASGVFSRGDTKDFNIYVAALKEGYKQVSEAAPRYTEGEYYYSQGQNLSEIPNNYKTESERYAEEHPLDVRKVVQTLNANAKKVYNIGSCETINTTGKNHKGEYYVHNNVRLVDTEEHKKQPGTKPEGFSLRLCASYAKCALAAGGWIYAQCDGGACRNVLLQQGFMEIYVSNSAEKWTASGFNRKWQTGDVMTIDGFTGTDNKKHKEGHIAVWNGKNWVSDFKQNSCNIYSGAETHWNNGGFHFFRYRNIKDK